MRAACLGAVALAGLAPAAGAQMLHYEGGLSLASGTYIFTQRTNSFTLATGLAFSAGPVTFRGGFPVFLQNTTLVASSGSMLLPTGGSSGGTVAESSAARGGRGGDSGRGSLIVYDPSLQVVQDPGDGAVDVPTTAVTGYQAHLGDPTFGANVALNGGGFGLLIGAGVKAPVTDTASFGTGAWDFGGSVSLSYRFGYAAVVSVDAGYWRMGDLPQLDLQDPVLLSASVSHLSLSGWGFSASLYSATSVIDGYPSSTSVSLGVLRVGARQSVGVTAGVGFTDTTPDFMFGVNWRFRLAGSY